MDGFSVLYASLAYVDSTQEVKGNSLHAGIGKKRGKGSGIMHISLLFSNSLSDLLGLVDTILAFGSDGPGSSLDWGNFFFFFI